MVVEVRAKAGLYSPRPGMVWGRVGDKDMQLAAWDSPLAGGNGSTSSPFFCACFVLLWCGNLGADIVHRVHRLGRVPLLPLLPMTSDQPAWEVWVFIPVAVTVYLCC